MHRRQAVDDVNYDDPLLGDEATDDETLNDTDNTEAQPEKAPAVIETKPTHYEVEAGGEIRLECKVAPENTVVQWYKGNQLYFIGNINLHPEEVRYSIAEDSKDLLIKSAELSDSDVFKCETVQKSLLAINHTLLVTQKPVIINMSASHGGNLAVGADLKLTCLVTASPVPTVIWSVTRRDNNQNDRLTEKDGEFSVDGNVYSMYIKNIKKSDAGQYYCYALNKLGSHQAEITVVVNGKPQVHVPRTIVNSGLNTEAILQCSAHEEARPHIRWYKDGSLVENIASKFTISTRGSHSNLTAANNFGRHNKSIDLVQSPVVEDLEVDGSAMTWVVHSHQPLEAMEVQLKPLNEDADWTSLDVPLPSTNGHKYEISYRLEDKQLDSGEYHAVVKVKNSKSWGGSNEPAVVKIEFMLHWSPFLSDEGASSSKTQEFTLRENKSAFENSYVPLVGDFEAPIRFKMRSRPEEAKTYDYRSARIIANPNSLGESIVHMLMFGLGAAVVAAHEAYYFAGMWTALGLNICIATINGYCVCTLVWSAQKLYGRLQVPTLTYPDIAEASALLSKWPKCRKVARCFRYTIEATLMMHLYGNCSVIVVMISRNLKQLVEGEDVVVDEATSDSPPLRVYILSLMLPFAIIVMITDLKNLAPFALIADLYAIAVALLTTYYAFMHHTTSMFGHPGYKGPTGAFQFTGVCVFTMESASIALPIENNMSDPKKFHYVVLGSAPTVTISMILIGFFGCWLYGSKAIAPITVHFPFSPFPITMKVFICMVLYVIYAVCFYVAFDIEWFYIKRYHHMSNYWFWERLYRCVHVIIITFIAYSFPFVTRVMSTVSVC
ncbi:unnamed protein product [Chrysodeixis includens]|uniref:Hemolin n=1 Tax=Chrysodeixis includens TaxID=689277 RepID=A0A9N8KYK7_CHRIL|nr:unnamed protein product [Chrysodeixis includens]